MYLHIGNGYSVRTSEIVGIFDIENTSISKSTKEYLANAEKLKRVIYTTFDLPKSFIVCFDKQLTERVYISQLACATLYKRMKRIRNNAAESAAYIDKYSI